MDILWFACLMRETKEYIRAAQEEKKKIALFGPLIKAKDFDQATFNRALEEQRQGKTKPVLIDERKTAAKKLKTTLEKRKGIPYSWVQD